MSCESRRSRRQAYRRISPSSPAPTRSSCRAWRPAALREEKDFAVTGAFERAGSEHVGRDADGIAIMAGIEDALGKGADVVIDFTAPSASLQHASVCAGRGIALVIGTTGFAAEQK